MSRESLARATNSDNLEMEPGKVHDVDRLTAAATGNVLGGLLLRVREAGQTQWLRRIVFILAMRVVDKFRMSRALAQSVAVAALEEFISPHCTACRGARVMVIEKLKIVCEACAGSGQQRFDNSTRRSIIGTYGRRIDDAMADLHRHMSASLGAYASHASARLA